MLQLLATAFRGDFPWGSVFEFRVPPPQVVEDLNVLSNECNGLSARRVPVVVHQLVLQTSPEALHWRVVIEIALARHRSLHAKLHEQPPVAVRAIFP